MSVERKLRRRRSMGVRSLDDVSSPSILYSDRIRSNSKSQRRQKRRKGAPWLLLLASAALMFLTRLLFESVILPGLITKRILWNQTLEYSWRLSFLTGLFTIPWTPPSPLEFDSTDPDFNDLQLSPVLQRVIDHDKDYTEYEMERRQELDEINYYPLGLDRRFQNDEDYVQEHSCRRNNWQSMHFPVCNQVHEMLVERVSDYDYEVKYLAHGAFRDSWRLHNRHDDFVFKRFRFEGSIGIQYMYEIHKEAIIMERLTASPRIVDIFGHCAMSIFSETMEHEVTADMVPGSENDDDRYGFMEQEELDKLQLEDVHPINNLTNDEKLDLAIVMAESIADIHGFEGGVIVHGDVHPAQWLQSTKTGLIKMNDFNNAEILEFDTNENDYCKIHRCYGGFYRSPEEFRCMDSNEGMDTYSFGNNIYGLLTGLWPYYQYGGDATVFIQGLLIHNTEKPFVDPRYRHRSAIESGLIKVMEECWEWDLDRRVSIFEVVKKLYALRKYVRGPNQG